MSEQPVRTVFERIIGRIAKDLGQCGYRKYGRSLKAFSDGFARIIEFQRTTSGTATQSRFTVNLGVVCEALLDTERVQLHRSETVDAHWRERLGFLLSDPRDVWWDLSSSTDEDAVAHDVTALLRSRALPLLDEFSNHASLLRLWRSGRSPGLTDGQRQRCLAELARATGEAPE